MDVKRLDHIRAWAKVYRGHLPAESHPHAAMLFELLDALDETREQLEVSHAMRQSLHQELEELRRENAELREWT